MYEQAMRTAVDEPTLIQDDDQQLPTHADRRRTIEDLLGDRLSPTSRRDVADALLVCIPPAEVIVEARKANSPHEDDILTALRTIRNQVGVRDGRAALALLLFTRFATSDALAGQLEPARPRAAPPRPTGRQDCSPTSPGGALG